MDYGSEAQRYITFPGYTPCILPQNLRSVPLYPSCLANIALPLHLSTPFPYPSTSTHSLHTSSYLPLLPPPHLPKKLYHHHHHHGVAFTSCLADITAGSSSCQKPFCHCGRFPCTDCLLPVQRGTAYTLLVASLIPRTPKSSITQSNEEAEY